MFDEKYQGSLVTVFYSIGSNPLINWAIQCKESEYRFLQDDVMKSSVLQIQSQNVNACSISTPSKPTDSLGIRLPFFTMLMKNLGRYFTSEITVLDDQNIRRRFRISNYSKSIRVSIHMCSMPVCLTEGWTQIQLNLADFTSQMYNTGFVEAVRVQVHANCRLRRIYFSEKLYTNDELPNEYRLYKVKVPRVIPVSTVLKKKAIAGKKT
ncbi:cilia- and flagella-associated protein 20-like [Sipha flava]|uniref:Cilia- and flagella-associated protein 20-like n=1 Tax=Sipha flava TaxID=143950 RepID=A0A8B8F4T6_9HEMI|nr:cilia- and flagella-associated protein 20-like [Sipha flava]